MQCFCKLGYYYYSGRFSLANAAFALEMSSVWKIDSKLWEICRFNFYRVTVILLLLCCQLDSLLHKKFMQSYFSSDTDSQNSCACALLGYLPTAVNFVQYLAFYGWKTGIDFFCRLLFTCLRFHLMGSAGDVKGTDQQCVTVLNNLNDADTDTIFWYHFFYTNICR